MHMIADKNISTKSQVLLLAQQPIAVTLCDPNSEELVDYEFFWLADANGISRKWFVFDYMRFIGQSRVSIEYVYLVAKGKTFIAHFGICAVQFYWTTGAPSYNNPRDYVSTSEVYMRFLNGDANARRVPSNNNWWPPVVYNSNTNPDKRCAEYEYVIMNAESFYV